jgi:hypothetical protein
MKQTGDEEQLPLRTCLLQTYSDKIENASNPDQRLSASVIHQKSSNDTTNGGSTRGSTDPTTLPDCRN